MADISDDRDGDLSRLIRDHATQYRASPALESAIRTEIALQSAATRPQVPESRQRWPAWWFVGMGFACGVLVSASLYVLGERSADNDRLETELVGSHIHALMANHLTDVASADQHTVKPWFQGKLSYSPPVKDLSQDGYPLVGGRLDYVSGKPVAALIYRRNGHLINLFVWPDSGGRAQEESTRQGYNVIRWATGGMAYSAVSDLNSRELSSFAEMVR